MSAVGANIRETWVPAKINARLAEYQRDLEAARALPFFDENGRRITPAHVRLFFFRAATIAAAEDLERIEAFGGGS